MKHPDGFLGIYPADILYLLDNVSDVQFYKLDTWPLQLFHRCSCCDLNREAAYDPITAEEAREWAERRING